METTNKTSRVKKAINAKKPLGLYKSMDELSAAKMASAKDFITSVDVTVFKKNGRVE